MPRVLSYFRGRAEAMHLALEVEPHVWRALHGNEPVLRGEVGTRTLRDPFVFRDHGGRFHLFTTDGWTSPHIVHAASNDLIIWSPQRLLGVMSDTPRTRNAWAPEAFWDRAIDAYRVVWSSTVGDATHDHSFWSSTTADLVEFTPGSLYTDPGHSVIDATISVQPEGDYLVFKDERGENRKGTPHKRLRTAFRPAGEVAFGPTSDEFSPELVEGPILLRDADGAWVVYYDCFMDGHWGAMRSVDFKVWQPFDVRFPEGVRHGSVVEVLDAEAEALVSRYGVADS